MFHICGSWWTDLKARSCPDDSLAIRQEPTTPQPPIASASHFFFRNELYFGLNVELALSPRDVYLMLDGIQHPLPLDLGSTTRGMYAIKLPETTGCRSY